MHCVRLNILRLNSKDQQRGTLVQTVIYRKRPGVYNPERAASRKRMTCARGAIG